MGNAKAFRGLGWFHSNMPNEGLRKTSWLLATATGSSGLVAATGTTVCEFDAPLAGTGGCTRWKFEALNIVVTKDAAKGKMAADAAVDRYPEAQCGADRLTVEFVRLLGPLGSVQTRGSLNFKEFVVPV